MKKATLPIFATLAGMVCAVFTACDSGKAEEQTRPNILICIADDASHMSIYGTPWLRTPGVDRIAREGVLFTRAYTPNAKCAPSRSCLLTGRYSWQLEEAANHWCYFPEKFATFFESLRENGYFTGFTGKGWAPGVVGEKEGKPRQLTGTPYQDLLTDPPAEKISSIDYAANFEAFLRDKPQDAPFCFWLGGFEPHRSYEFGAGIRKGNKKLSDIDRVFSFWPDTDSVRTDILDYAFEVEYFDSHVQKALEILESNGQLENTLIIATSDHGMPFPRVKGQAYEVSNHVPMAIMWREGIRSPGRVVEDYVSFVDLAPTVMEIVGIAEEQSGMQPISGESLTDILYSDRSGLIKTGRDHVLVGKERHDIGRPGDAGYPIRGIIKGGYLYLKNFKPARWPAGNPETGYLNTDGSPTKTVILDRRLDPDAHKFWVWSFGKRPEEELYFLPDDPGCIHNLAGDPVYDSTKVRLRDQLFKTLEEQNDPRMSGNGDVFDQYEYAHTRHRNFYEKYMRGEDLEAGWVNPSDFRPIEGE